MTLMTIGEPAGALRQVLIADQRTATSDTPVCDLTLRSANRPHDPASLVIAVDPRQR